MVDAAQEAIAKVVGAIVDGARAKGGATYQEIKVAIDQRTDAYGGTLHAISMRAKNNEISPAEVAKATSAATLSYTTSISAQVQHISLAAIQAFLNDVIAVAKDTINAALPIPVL